LKQKIEKSECETQIWMIEKKICSQKLGEEHFSIVKALKNSDFRKNKEKLSAKLRLR
jgi:transcription initiation factor IIE alpha subunit